MYDKIIISEKFQEGRSLLNTGFNDEAISIFSEIVSTVENFIDVDNDAKVTWANALNNIGIAKCSLGYSSGDKKLFLSGIQALRAVIDAYPSEMQERLTAKSNLEKFEKKLSEF